jgi:hypothetical protein
LKHQFLNQDKEGNFRIKIKDQIKPEKFSYDDAYCFLSDEMTKFFQTFTESIVKEQHKIFKERKNNFIYI